MARCSLPKIDMSKNASVLAITVELIRECSAIIANLVHKKAISSKSTYNLTIKRAAYTSKLFKNVTF